MRAQRKLAVPPKDEHVNPVDSLQGLKDRGLDPRSYGSCAERIEHPQHGLQVLGCRAFHFCDEATKGTGRPCCYGVSIVKPPEMGGGVREVQMNCYEYFLGVDQAELRGMVWDRFREGEPVLLSGSQKKRDENGQLVKNDDGTVQYEDTTFDDKVAEFKTISQNPKLKRAVYAAAVMDRNRARLAKEKREEILSGANRLPEPGVDTGGSDGGEAVGGEAVPAGKPKRR